MQVAGQHNPDKTSVEERVQTLLSDMTLAEKIGQMTQVEKNSITPQAVSTHYIGSILSGGGGNPQPNNVHTWREMAQTYIEASLQTRLAIPLLYGSDGVHGHSNVVGATVFPHNIGLGAAHDADLVRRIAAATASELLATHALWNFAPAVSVPQDLRWGRTYEGFSEDTALVTELGLAYIAGLQERRANGEWVLASVKHFAADGGTGWDTRKKNENTVNSEVENWQAASEHWRIDQGDAQMDEATLRRVHLAPYKAAVAGGARNIMVSFSSWNGLKMHAHEYLLTQVLKEEWGFDGFLVSDWMAIYQLAKDVYTCIVTAINAGLDMIMVPYDYAQFITELTRAVQHGDVSMARIDDAVTRILRVKMELGLFERPLASADYIASVGSQDHRALAREAVQKSLVLLKNDAALPLKPAQNVAVVGTFADDIGMACGGWTIEWQGASGSITQGATLLDGLKAHYGDDLLYSADGHLSEKVDVAVVVVGETPYAEGEGDYDDLTLSPQHRALIDATRPNCDKLVLVIYSGRPLIIKHVADQCDAIVAAWLPGSEADAIAANLLGNAPFTGKLAYNWPASMAQLPLSVLQASDEAPQWVFGHGLSL